MSVFVFEFMLVFIFLLVFVPVFSLCSYLYLCDLSMYSIHCIPITHCGTQSVNILQQLTTLILSELLTSLTSIIGLCLEDKIFILNLLDLDLKLKVQQGLFVWLLYALWVHLSLAKSCQNLHSL